MLLELAVGDAYGAGFEYVEDEYVRKHNDLSRYHKHPRHRFDAGQYTDDTQMSLAICEALLSDKDWTPELLADMFVNVFKRDQREGYAGRFYDFLCSVRNGSEFLQRIKPDSDKSGAAMRAMPLGLLGDIQEVIKYAEVQARITHDTPGGIKAAKASALTTHYFFKGVDEKKNLGRFLSRVLKDSVFLSPWKGKVGSRGMMSVRAAITALQCCDTMTSLLKTCVDYHGDVDTVAAIALAAASFSPEIRHDLPAILIDGLETGPYGREYLERLDKRMLERFGCARNG